MSLQTTLFEHILSKYSKKAEAVDAISAHLNLSKDGIYRRIRGETVLTPDELASLAKHYQISLDELVYGQTNQILFSYTPFTTKLRSFQDWLELTYQNLERVYQIPEVHIFYASQEIPIHLYFQFPKLLHFRAYLLSLTSNLDFGRSHDLPFNFSILRTETLALASKFSKLYITVPSTELWNLGIFDNTLNAIEYLLTIDKYEEPQFAIQLCEELFGLIEHTKRIAASGKKQLLNSDGTAPGASFELYYNELADTNNSIFVTSPLGNRLFTTYSNPNFLSTNNQKLCDYTQNWFKVLMEKSTSISQHSSVNRDWFFKQLEKKVQQTQRRLERML